ncbi:MAG: response regulator transcription factor [Chitinophagaceae bacterium]|nr:response regulator transcription factor [Chitinophagaceae bacterium]MCB9046400.1 response regulator transcription factor [Chitinophagales bacterium]
MKALIIDNSEQVRTALVEQLSLFCTEEITHIHEAEGVNSGLSAINEIKPDIVFLDVEMDDGTGLELLTRLGTVTFQLVFVTAYNKYAVDAFKFSAIDFLLKPVDPEELIAAVAKAKLNIEQRDTINQVKVLQEALLYNSDKKIVLRNSDAIYIVKVSEIIHCRAEGSYTHFNLTEKREILISKGLKEYEDLLAPFHFVRTHHAHLVNLNKIVRMEKADGGTLVLDNGTQVPVSQRKREHILQLINNL